MKDPYKNYAQTEEDVFLKVLKDIPQYQQRQDGTREQLQDLWRVAVRLGMYDAADCIKKNFLSKQ